MWSENRMVSCVEKLYGELYGKFIDLFCVITVLKKFSYSKWFCYYQATF